MCARLQCGGRHGWPVWAAQDACDSSSRLLAPCCRAEDGSAANLRLAGRMGSYNSVSSTEASAAAAAARAACPLDVHTAGAEPEEGASNIPGRPHIYPMPPNPLALLRELHELLKVGWGGGGAVAGWGSGQLGGSTRPALHRWLGRGWGSDGRRGACPAGRQHTARTPHTGPPALRGPSPPSLPPPLLAPAAQGLVDHLRQKCLEEPRSSDRPSGYSALVQDAKEFAQEVGGWVQRWE